MEHGFSILMLIFAAALLLYAVILAITKDYNMLDDHKETKYIINKCCLKARGIYFLKTCLIEDKYSKGTYSGLFDRTEKYAPRNLQVSP